MAQVNDSFALPFGGHVTKSYDFELTEDQKKSIVDRAKALPNFLIVAAEFWTQFFTDGKSAEDVLKDLLAELKVSSTPTFQITGSCNEFDSIKIEWSDPEIPQTSVPGVTIEAKPRALDLVNSKCSCWLGEKPPSGKCKCRTFLIKWWVNISIKGINRSFIAQINDITVCSPCCCTNDAGDIREEPLEKGRQEGSFKSPAIPGGQGAGGSSSKDNPKAGAASQGGGDKNKDKPASPQKR